MADGGKTTSRCKCDNFKWQIQGVTFTHNFRIINLGGCDLILGADWMWEHSPVSINLKENKLSVLKKRIEIEFSGDDKTQEVRMITAKSLDNYLHKNDHGIMVQLFAIIADTNQGEVDVLILRVLHQYEGVFTEPNELPPKRNIEHEINLKPGTQPIFQRAYRYSHSLKDEIEKMVKEMLSQD